MTTTEACLFKMPISCQKIQRLAIPIYLKGCVLPEVGSAGADQVIEQIQSVLCEQETLFLGDIEEGGECPGAMLYFSKTACDAGDYTASFNAMLVKDGYAVATLDEPSRDILNVLKSNQAYARSDKLGLWQTGELDDLDKNG